MGFEPGEPFDDTDLYLANALARNGRAEVTELAAALGVSERFIRERLRKLRQSGVLREYHAVVAENRIGQEHALVLLRFVGSRPSVAELSAIEGVTRVYALGAGWDFMLELVRSELRRLIERAGDRGRVAVLGGDADFELLRVVGKRSRGYGDREDRNEVWYLVPPA